MMVQEVIRRADVKKTNFESNITGVPAQMKLESQAGPVFDDVRVQYSWDNANVQNQPAVVQRKQIVKLRKRLQQLNADISSKNPDFKTYLEKYDELENKSETKEQQLEYLQVMLQLLEEENSDEAQRARRVIMDEYYFACNQNYAQSFEVAVDPWRHMDGSPLIVALQLLAAEQDIPGVKGKQLPAQQLIQILSRDHLKKLQPEPDSFEDSINTLFCKVCQCILSGGVLAHYSHKKDISVLHSTDYLKANNLLDKNAEANTSPRAEQVVTKSQPVDTSYFRNTGFVFMFLERASAAPRRTRFGSYRYCVPLSSAYGLSLLSKGWAILHDLAGFFKQPESKEEDTTVTRIVTSIEKFNPDKFITRLETLTSKCSESERQDVQKVLELIIPTEQYDTYFTRPGGNPKSGVLQSNLSANFLFGPDILHGVAMRVAQELHILSQFAPEEYTKVLKSTDSLWNYILTVVFDMQIMLPESVMADMPHIEEGKI